MQIFRARSANGRLAALFLAFVFPAIFSSPLFAQVKRSTAETALFDSLNRERASRNLPALRWDDTLAAAARKHALLMAQHNTLSHQLSGEPPLQDRGLAAGARFNVISENIAEGPDADTIHGMWMKSTHHKANILDRDVNSVGISVVQGTKYLFAVQDFSHALENLSLYEQEQRIATLLHAQGLQINSAKEDARKTCAMKDGYTGKPSTMFRFEGGDLSALPDGVLQKLKSGRYHSASVGACNPGKSNSFARYRIAILLY